MMQLPVRDICHDHSGNRGSGIVGRPLIAHLLARGQSVVGLCRHPEEMDTSGLRWLKGDVSKPKLGLDDNEWQQLCREVDSIFI